MLEDRCSGRAKEANMDRFHAYMACIVNLTGQISI